MSNRLVPAALACSVVMAAPAALAQDYAIEEITWALPSLPETLFVPHAWSTANGAIMSLVQEGPLAFADDLSLTEGVAESWEQVDPTTVRYTLRDDVTFSDGSALTADDVVATMDFHMADDSGSQLASFYSSVESVEASGEYEVTVHLTGPDAMFQYTPAHMAGFIFQTNQLETEGESIGTPEALPLGTGPYVITEFAPAERVVLEARDDYWGDTPTVGKITMVSIPDAQSRFLAMQSGDIDGTFNVPVTDIGQWQSLDGVEVVTAPSLSTFVLPLDTTTPPFDDVHVRRAIAHAVDREGLVQALLGGNGEPLETINPPEMWAGVMAPEEVNAFYDTLPGYDFDMDLAAEELAQSEHPDGFTFTAPVSNTQPEMVTTLQSLAQNLSQIGITMNIEEMDYNQWLAQYFRHEDLGMQVMNYFPDFADPANYPYLFMHSDNAVVDGMNASNYANPEVDSLIDTALEESDAAARADALKQVFEIVHEDVPLVPIYTPYSVMAINSDYQMSGYNAFWYNIPWAMRGFGPAE